METSKRFGDAIKKLYTAFYNKTLNPECCKQCAVGNILDQNDSWKHLSDHHGTTELNYVGRVHQLMGRRFNGYTPLELLKIESVFLKACGFQIPIHYKNQKPKNPTNPDILFKGLSEVVRYLCRLDRIENVMDYTSIFKQQSTAKKTLKL
ncbi:Na(+)-translocating NADH-quinone reductase subunit F [Winogradskyella sp. A3E31]|uniref:Na(+)-translocating NADH-quinone reductase subunit F n=1 Tax=Winogradskyella sp. A3E31 TaxID=3349637 RepID=UPI00398B12AE